MTPYFCLHINHLFSSFDSIGNELPLLLSIQHRRLFSNRSKVGLGSLAVCYFSKFLCGDKVEWDVIRKSADGSNTRQSLALMIFMSTVKAREEEKNDLSILSHTKTEQPEIRYKAFLELHLKDKILV